mmetsp:Transcript_61189/g.144411  ORF Transcript_61189/g.144411 Transcript_61189/m.144411 type:complete len:443 (-) Transcript_61189:162-1490(-)
MDSDDDSEDGKHGTHKSGCGCCASREAEKETEKTNNCCCCPCFGSREESKKPRLRKVRNKSYKDRESSDTRRRRLPPGKWIKERPKSLLWDERPGWKERLIFKHGYFKSKAGHHMYYSSATPCDVTRIKRVIVFFHNITDNVAFLTHNVMMAYAQQGSNAVIAVDLPGHGRSDGICFLIENWTEFVAPVHDFVTTLVLPLRDFYKAYNPKSTQEIPVFAHGEDLGAGVVVSLCLESPGLFAGAVLVSPMALTDASARAPALAAFCAKRLLLPWFPWATLAPTKELAQHSWSDPRMVYAVQTAPLGANGRRMRLATWNAVQSARAWMSRELPNFNTPFLIQESCQSAKPFATFGRELAAVAKAQDKELKDYPGLRAGEVLHGGHQGLLQKALADATEWLKARSPSRSSHSAPATLERKAAWPSQTAPRGHLVHCRSAHAEPRQ